MYLYFWQRSWQICRDLRTCLKISCQHCCSTEIKALNWFSFITRSIKLLSNLSSQ
uniref:Uncharacterized protein n=1 Tax=Lotus japonicus TaxID=34305 RepID=I3T674_LOTJA|nr:unknown [Lotus japonicus]